MNRRELVISTAGLIMPLALGACATGDGSNTTVAPQSAANPKAPKSLKAWAASKGMRFGNAVGVGYSDDAKSPFNDPKTRQILIEECSILVPENELKQYVVKNNSNDQLLNFAPAKKLAKFAKENYMELRGHTMLWARDEYTPKWQINHDFGANKAENAEKMIREYVIALANEFKDQINSWDVVNEAIDPKDGKVRQSAFTRAMGTEALKIAYLQARETLPSAQLVYNDYMSWEQGNENHRDGVIKLLRWFRDNNVPVDALGVQSHIGTGFSLQSKQVKEWQKFIDEAVGMGYKLLITEFDVNDQRVAGSIEERDKLSAKVAKEYLDMMFSYKELKDVLCWGITDNHSWLQGFSPRADLLPLRPTPFSSDYQKKPLYYAIEEAFKNAPIR